MPQLSSGRHIAFSQPGIPESADDTDGWNAMEQIETIEDLYAYVSVDLFREATRFDGHRLAAMAPPHPNSNRMPDGLVSYPSGYTVAELAALTADWSEDEARELREFIAGDRFQNHMRSLLRQLHIATGKVEPTLVDVVLYDPKTRELFERVDD